MIEIETLLQSLYRFPNLVDEEKKLYSFFINYSQKTLTYGGIYSIGADLYVLIAIEDERDQIKTAQGTETHEGREVFKNVILNFKFLKNNFLDEGKDSYSIKTDGKILTIYLLGVDKQEALSILFKVSHLPPESFFPFFKFISFFPEGVEGFEFQTIYFWFNKHPVESQIHSITNTLGNYFKDNEVINLEMYFPCDCFPKKDLSHIWVPKEIITKDMKPTEKENRFVNSIGNLILFDTAEKYRVVVGYRKDKKESTKPEIQAKFADMVFDSLKKRFSSRKQFDYFS